MQKQLRQTRELQAQRQQLNEQLQRELAAQQSIQRQMQSASRVSSSTSYQAVPLAFSFATSIVGRRRHIIISIINSR